MNEIELNIDEATRAKLQRFGFDAESFAQLRERLRDPSKAVDNAVRGALSLPEASDVRALPRAGSEARKTLEAQGKEALARGKVAAVVLAGGMATRFGGVVKAGVPAAYDRTFLDLKLSDIANLARRLDARIPIALMTSFATHDEVDSLSAPFDSAQTPVSCFPQFISLRLDPNGGIFREQSGAASLYAPGHGDLTFAMRRAGLLERYRATGIELLFMSNVDNLGATLDPAIIGAHMASGAAISAEVVRKASGDKGGAPARVDGKPQIVEAFRFPADFDQDSIPVFNTNTFVLDIPLIDREFELTFFKVEKKVEDRPAIQFERLVGQLTAFLPTAFIEVERDGEDGRFQPVKDPDELDRRRADIEHLLRARGVVEG